MCTCVYVKTHPRTTGRWWAPGGPGTPSPVPYFLWTHLKETGTHFGQDGEGRRSGLCSLCLSACSYETDVIPEQSVCTTVCDWIGPHNMNNTFMHTPVVSVSLYWEDKHPGSIMWIVVFFFRVRTRQEVFNLYWDAEQFCADMWICWVSELNHWSSHGLRLIWLDRKEANLCTWTITAL